MGSKKNSIKVNLVICFALMLYVLMIGYCDRNDDAQRKIQESIRVNQVVKVFLIMKTEKPYSDASLHGEINSELLKEVFDEDKFDMFGCNREMVTNYVILEFADGGKYKIFFTKQGNAHVIDGNCSRDKAYNESLLSFFKEVCIDEDLD